MTHLRRHAASAGLDELARKLHTDAASVRRKLDELGLSAQGEPGTAGEELAAYAEALALMHRREWARAAPLLEKVAAETDNRQLADRARQGLETCRRHTAPPAADASPYLQAIYEKNRGNVEAAFELCRALGKPEDDERHAYLLASLHSLAGSPEKALQHLETAIRLEPKNRVHAYHDPDFAELRGRAEFASLIGGLAES
ncbi:MAG TPA: hypothetical protein VGG06_17535 [Thermoanaerobaculia bacterium]